MQDFAHESGNTVCPAKRAVFSTLVVTCEMSIFQTPVSKSLWQKRLFLLYKTPTLLCHNSIWIFHFPTHQQVSLRCLENTWTPGTAILFRNGIIYNASTCPLTTADFHTCRNCSDALVHLSKRHICTCLIKLNSWPQMNCRQSRRRCLWELNNLTGFNLKLLSLAVWVTLVHSTSAGPPSDTNNNGAGTLLYPPPFAHLS